MHVYHGGLMRCCLASLDDYLEAGGSEAENTVVPCKYCDNSMVVAWVRSVRGKNELAWMWAGPGRENKK